jgi:hypothetical protein
MGIIHRVCLLPFSLLAMGGLHSRSGASRTHVVLPCSRQQWPLLPGAMGCDALLSSDFVFDAK